MIAASLLIVAFGISPLAASSLNQFIGFGDSTLDSGWWRGALVGQCGGAVSPCTTGSPIKDAKIASAIANGGTGAPVGVGVMHSQLLAAKLGLAALPANQRGGTNYAISGSKNAVSGGSGNLNPNPNLPSTVDQIGNYLIQNGGIANPNALYVVSSGANDITYAMENFSTLADKETYLSTQAAALVGKLHALQNLGAQHLLVDSVQGDGHLANFYNQTLFSDLANAGIHFVKGDIAALIATVEADPTAYGFTARTVLRGLAGDALNTTSACVAGVGASGWGQWCADSTSVSPNHSHLRSKDSQQTSFFSDDQHLSASGQLIEANYEFSLLQSMSLNLQLRQ